MDVEDKINDPIVMVFLRNEFYKRKFYLALSVYVLSLFVVAILIGMLVFLIKNPPAPLYFPADDVGRLIQDVPLTAPNMPLDEVTAWAVEAVEASYSYDFMNYRSQLQGAQKYFSAYGLHKYLQGLNASNNLLALTQRKMIFIAKVINAPKLLDQGILKTGAYGYKYDMQVLVTYMIPPYDEKSSFQNPLIVSLVIQRQNLLQSYKGLGIMQMNAAIATAAPSANMNTGGG